LGFTSAKACGLLAAIIEAIKSDDIKLDRETLDRKRRRFIV
jgi:hypothetical protein